VAWWFGTELVHLPQAVGSIVSPFAPSFSKRALSFSVAPVPVAAGGA
jgi:hypothetical protein